MILEAWSYTRKTGTEVVHVAATGFQGIPSGVALGTNSPDNGDDLIYTSDGKTMTRVSLVTRKGILSDTLA